MGIRFETCLPAGKFEVRSSRFDVRGSHASRFTICWGLRVKAIARKLGQGDYETCKKYKARKNILAFYVGMERETSLKKIKPEPYTRLIFLFPALPLETCFLN